MKKLENARNIEAGAEEMLQKEELRNDVCFLANLALSL
jgi:hypothetical protein